MTDATPTARYADLLQPLPRRRGSEGTREAIRASLPLKPATPGVIALVRRMTWWTLVMGFLGLRVAAARLRGPLDYRWVGARLRQAFERLGGTAIKLGQQLAIRVDLLPYEVCTELGELLDAVPPFEVAYAVERIEHATGRPLGETFQRFDPEPIGSASIACVYLAELLDGRRVAVKVRRPGIRSSFAADLAVVSFYTTLLERLSLVRPGFFSKLREEMVIMFNEELDFEKESRYQRLFRKYTRDLRVRWMDAPKVHHELCGEDVIVSDYVDAISCTTLLQLVESEDTRGLEQLAAQGIQPEIVGLRIWLASLVGTCELPFFHGDPHPGNILILPGNKLMFIDFGACGVTDALGRLFTFDIYLHQMFDHSGLANESGMGLLWPLPRLDITAFRRETLVAFQEAHDAWRDVEAPWYERTSTSLWLAFLEVVRRHRIPMTRDTLRNMRSTLLYDTIAGRLRGAHGYDRFGPYARRAQKRYLRRMEKTRLRRERLPYVTYRALAMSEQVYASLFRLARSLDRPQQLWVLPTIAKAALVLRLGVVQLVWVCGILVVCWLVVQWNVALAGLFQVIALSVLLVWSLSIRRLSSHLIRPDR